MVQLHPDADSMALHVGIVAERAPAAYAETVGMTTSIQVFGTPSNAVLELLQRQAGAGVPLSIKGTTLVPSRDRDNEQPARDSGAEPRAARSPWIGLPRSECQVRARAATTRRVRNGGPFLDRQHGDRYGRSKDLTLIASAD